MKTLDLDFTRATARAGGMETRAAPADHAFEGALRGATERDENAAEETAAEDDGGAGDDARAAGNDPAGDSASLPLVVAPPTTPCGAQAQATPPSCAAGAQRSARPGASGEAARAPATGGAPALSREGEHGKVGSARARERAGSPGADVALHHGIGDGGAPPARGAAPAREELGVRMRRPEAGDDVAGARRDVPSADGAQAAAPAPHDRATPALDFTSLRPQPAAALEISATELSRPTPAAVHLRSAEPVADGAVLQHAAHLRVAAPGVGDVELHLRVLDGVAHLRVDGDAARVVESRAAELSRALAGEGLKLGQLDTRTAPPQSGSAAGDSASRHSQHQGSGDRRDEPPSGGAPHDPAPRRGRASQASPTSPVPNGRYAVRA